MATAILTPTRDCQELLADSGLTFIHPFDDLLVIAGQGTIGDEIVRHRHENLAAVFVPVGGGGLIAGIGGYIKAVMPNVRVIGVEPFESDAMYQSLQAGRRVMLDQVGIFADGVAVRSVGEVTFDIARRTVDEVIRVSNDEICAAIKDIFDDTRTIMEPAGALAVAGLKRYVERGGAGQQAPEHLRSAASTGDLVAVLSGANMNFDRLRFVAERAELGEAREVLFAVTIPERPGAFRAFCSSVGPRVVTEFNYRLNSRRAAHIFVGLSIDSRQDAAQLADRLRAAGYETLDLSDNEMAKLHIRHMVGGPAPDVHDERIYRFEFPERPGALMRFLENLGDRWNISLFHYRNHGADFGRVLVGFEVSDAEEGAFTAFLATLGYAYLREADNDAYRRFLTTGT